MKGVQKIKMQSAVSVANVSYEDDVQYNRGEEWVQCACDRWILVHQRIYWNQTNLQC